LRTEFYPDIPIKTLRKAVLAIRVHSAANTKILEIQGQEVAVGNDLWFDLFLGDLSVEDVFKWAASWDQQIN